MRTILFSGKRTDNGEWVYGLLTSIFIDPLPFIDDSIPTRRTAIQTDFESYEKCKNFEVIPETVGQFTGFTCEKGKKQFVGQPIWEGDVFRHTEIGENGAEDREAYSVVMWLPQRGAFYMIPVEHYHVLKDNDCSEETEFDWLFQDASLYDYSIDCGLAKVGNIHDNPELLNA